MNSSLSFGLRRLLPIAVAAVAIAGCDADGSKHYEKGLSLYQLRDYKGAAECFDKAAEIAPGDVDAKVMSARAWMRFGDAAAANDSIALASALAPNDTDVLLLAAEIAFHRQEYGKSVELYTRVIEDAKSTREARSLAYTGRGIVKTTLEQIDLARIDLMTAIRQDRRNAAARYHLALLYRDGYGYTQAAIEEFRFFVRINEIADQRVQEVQSVKIPELQNLIQQAAAERPGASKRDPKLSGEALIAADAAFKKGRWREAKSKYLEAYTADTLSYPAAMGVAKAIAKIDSSEEGKAERLKYLRYACELRPMAISTFIEAGDIAFLLRRYSAAAEHYSRAVAADSGNITAIDGLIRSLRRSGGKNDIAAAYQRYRETIPVRVRKSIK